MVDFGLDIELDLKDESVQKDSRFSQSIYHSRKLQRVNRFGRIDESFHLERVEFLI